MKAPTRLMTAEHARSRYFVTAEPGTPLSAVQSTAFWAHVAKQLKPLDVVEVVALDGAFDVEMRLLSKTPARLNWRILRETRGDAAPILSEVEGAFMVIHKGRGMYAVKERKTGDVLADGLSKEEAEAERVRLEAERKAA